LSKRWVIDPKVPLINGVPSSSAAIVAGNTIYLSGKTAGRDESEQIAGKGDIDAQVVRVLERMKADLQLAGATLADVVMTTVYVTDASFREAWQRIKVQYFSNPPPAATFVVVTALADPDILIEVEAIAVTD
jgi:enamine deaminase RidA (YjgF/YER057c/UK114 family)